MSVFTKSTRDIARHLSAKADGTRIFHQTGVNGFSRVSHGSRGTWFLVPDILGTDPQLLATFVRAAGRVANVSCEPDHNGRGKFAASRTGCLPTLSCQRPVIELDEETDWPLAILFLTPKQLDKAHAHLEPGTVSRAALKVIQTSFPGAFKIPAFAEAIESHLRHAGANSGAAFADC